MKRQHAKAGCPLCAAAAKWVELLYVDERLGRPILETLQTAIHSLLARGFIAPPRMDVPMGHLFSKASDRARATRQARAALGLCPACGDACERGYRQCRSCREKDRCSKRMNRGLNRVRCGCGKPGVKIVKRQPICADCQAKETA